MTREPDAPNPPLPPPLIFALFFLAAFLLDRVLPVQFLPAEWNRIPALLLSLGGLGIFAATAVAFRRARTPLNPYAPARILLTTGPFLRTRNPLYLGLAWIYLGLASWTASLWPFLLFPALILTMNRLVIAREEAHLEERFGDAYREYRAHVRRWM